MNKYILVYDYDCDGGIQSPEVYDSLELLDLRVNELLSHHKYQILFAGKISEQYKYEPVEVVTKFKRQVK